MMLSRLYNKHTRAQLDVYWWRREPSKGLNFGDEITPFVIEKLWGYRCRWRPPEQCQIAGAGSIIEVLQNNSGGNPTEVWGSGFIKEGGQNKKPNLKFRAVRGVLSQDRVVGKPVLGDPGLLIPFVVKPATSFKFKYGIVPHYTDHNDPLIKQLLKSLPNSSFIDVLSEPKKVAKEISSCEIILSSSLHGLILADAYGVPNLRLDVSQNIIGQGYKYRDYASSVGRSIPALTPPDIKNLSPNQIEKTANNAEIGIINKLQQGLIDSFPY